MLHDGTSGWSGRENLHTIKSYGQPLGVTCECGRKLAIPLNRPTRRQHGAAQVAQARLPGLRLTELEGDVDLEQT
jgi:hypothetical protein